MTLWFDFYHAATINIDPSLSLKGQILGEPGDIYVFPKGEFTITVGDAVDFSLNRFNELRGAYYGVSAIGRSTVVGSNIPDPNESNIFC